MTTPNRFHLALIRNSAQPPGHFRFVPKFKIIYYNDFTWYAGADGKEETTGAGVTLYPVL